MSQHRGEAAAAQEQLCRGGTVFLSQQRGGDRQAYQAQRTRRARDHHGQPGVSPARHPAGKTPPARLRMARHRYARQSLRGFHLHRGHREAPGTEDRLPRGDRLQQRMDHARTTAPVRHAHGEERLWPVSPQVD